MALKNQKDKNVKGASPIRKPQLKGKQNKKNPLKTLEQIFWQKRHFRL